MKFLGKGILFAIAKLAGANRIRNMISAIANIAGIDLLLLAYNNIGILNCQNSNVSGEYFLANKVLKKNLGSFNRPVIFDVGANIGKYSLMMFKELPHAQIYAFEPNRNSFEQLVRNVDNVAICFNTGLGSEDKTEKIFTYSNNLASSHASAYKEMFHKFHRTGDIVGIDIQMTTIDSFCKLKYITNIDFLKIDTEGNELNVLKGAEKMLAEGRIKIIQFEFGECDIFSRVFLKDFYTILADYNIYRLDSERLIPLFEYDVANEIFRFQNFVAIRKDFASLGGV